MNVTKLPETLEAAISSGNCIPFVGAGVSISVQRADGTGSLFPSWRSLLLKSADRLEIEGKASEASLVRSLVLADPDPDYLYAASRARKSLGPVWYSFLSKELDPQAELADLHSLELARRVWQLNSNLLITTNYDRVLTWACPDAKNLQSWNIEAPAEMVAASRSLNRPTVWHLHGTIDDASKLILTPDGYSRIYPTPASEPLYQAALITLKSVLMQKTILFIGFSGADQHFGSQLRAVAEAFRGANGPHYILCHKKDLAAIRSLSLPVEPIAFEEYGPPQIALLTSLCKSQSVANDAADKQERVDRSRRQKQLNEGAARTPGLDIDTTTSPSRLICLSQVVQWDPRSLREFRQQLRSELLVEYPEALSDREFLQRVGCLRNDHLTLAGVLVFSSGPSAASPDTLASAMTQCIKYDGETKSSRRIREKFDCSVLSQMIRARDFIANNIPSIEEPTAGSMQARRVYKFPMVCIREVLANAICHRNYADQKRMTYVRIFSDRIEVMSPGSWSALSAISGVAQPINRLTSQSVQMNFVLSHLVSMVSVVEMEGSGLPTAVRDCLDSDAPLPVAKLADGYVVVTIFPCREWDWQTRGAKKKSAPAVSELDRLLAAIAGATEQAEDLKLMSLHSKLAEEYLRLKRPGDAIAAAEIAISIANLASHTSGAGEARLVHYKATRMLPNEG